MNNTRAENETSCRFTYTETYGRCISTINLSLSGAINFGCLMLYK